MAKATPKVQVESTPTSQQSQLPVKFDPKSIQSVTDAICVQQGDKLPDGTPSKRTIFRVPTLKELKAAYPGKSTDWYSDKLRELGESLKVNASAFIGAVQADKAYLFRRLTVTPDKKGLNAVTASFKQTNTEDLVEKLARIHGKDVNEVRKALGIQEPLTIAA